MKSNSMFEVGDTIPSAFQNRGITTAAKANDIIRLCCVSRHILKCNRGAKCPFPPCGKISDQNVQKVNSLAVMKCYTKYHHDLVCFQQASPQSPIYRHIQSLMKQIKETYLPESPLKLQLLAACALPPEMELGSHPHCEEMLRLKNSAKRIQRKWRSWKIDYQDRQKMECRKFNLLFLG